MSSIILWIFAVGLEHFFREWQFIFDNSPYRNELDTFNLILANIFLTSPPRKWGKNMELIFLLNKPLKKGGYSFKSDRAVLTLHDVNEAYTGLKI